MHLLHSVHCFHKFVDLSVLGQTQSMEFLFFRLEKWLWPVFLVSFSHKCLWSHLHFASKTCDVILVFELDGSELDFQILNSSLLFWNLNLKCFSEFIIVLNNFIQLFFYWGIDFLKFMVVLGHCFYFFQIVSVDPFQIAFDQDTHFDLKNFKFFKMVFLYFLGSLS